MNESMIYLDNAATSYPKPKAVTDSVQVAFKKYGANPGRSGHEMAMETAGRIFESRMALSEFFGAAGAEQICFTLNTTYGANMALKGLLQKGDHIIISSYEHNAVYRAVYDLWKKGVSYDIAQVVPEDDEKTVEHFAAKIRPNTKMVACMYASNVFGHIFPIDKLSGLAKAHKLLFFVDAAQAAGLVPIDVTAQGIDCLCFSPHKGLYCPSGVGVIIARKGLFIEPLIHGGTGSASLSPQMPDHLPDRLEGGTLNTNGIIAITEGLTFLKEQGIESIHKKEIDLLCDAYDFLSAQKEVVLYAGRPNEKQCVPVLSFNVKGYDSMDIASLLNEEGICVRAGLHCAPLAHKSKQTVETGTVRISPSVFSTKNEINILCNAMEKILKNL